MSKARVATRKRQNAVARYFRETVAELQKVNWPTRQEATRMTVIVLVVVFVMSSVLGLLDYVFSRLISIIVGLG